MNIKRGAVFSSLASGFLFVLGVLVLFPCQATATEVVNVVEVKIRGNLRVEEDGIRIHLKARPGSPLDSATVDQDVRSIYRMGFFDDVKAEVSPDGILTYIVKEKPYIKEITIEGNSKVGKDKIETALGIRPRTILDKDKVAEGVEKVKKLYEESGYGNAKVDYAISPAENNQASIVMYIAEGEQLLIEKISFEGNHSFSDSELKGLMGTKEKWFLSFITGRGVLDQDILTNDVAVLAAYYYDHGYVRHKIDEPVILRGSEGIQIFIRIQEGEQYRVGKVELGGDMIEEPEKLLQSIKLTSGQILRGNRLRDDINGLTEKYANRGFAFVKVEPVTKVDDQAKKVDIAYVITRGPPVYFNRVVIAGNTKTRDKVVRREMKVDEQELFSGNKIKESRNALQRTGYFEDVQLNTKKTERPDTVDLLVDVKEGSTGTFSIGAGYDSGNSISVNLAITERNLFGRGQSLSANGTLGSVDQNFVLSFTEPYVNDKPLSLGVSGFKSKNEYSSFNLSQLGFAISSGYPLSELNGLPFFGTRTPALPSEAELDGREDVYSALHYMRAGVTYGLTHQNISGVSENASQDLKDSEGTSLTSSVTPSVSYDSRDQYFNPTEGAIGNTSFKLAGLGGTTYFFKGDLAGKWYYPVFKDPDWGGTYTLSLGGAIGYGVGYNGPSSLPLFERYFPGGINSVRGFEDRSLGPRDSQGDLVGGSKQGILNVELIFPILERMGLRGVAFFDMGEAFRHDQSISWGGFRRSVGFGARWQSPFGPLRAELGFPLNARSYDKTSILGFSFGQ